MNPIKQLTFTNSQASIHDFFIRDLARWLAAQTSFPIEFVSDATWAEREARLDAGEIDLGWICGAPYVEKIARGIPLEILAAPVMAHARYQNLPLYFSDVVVRAESKFQTFGDLRGARWAYNEKNSHSGYHVIRYYLATQNLNGKFFGRVVESGAHQNSVEMILREQVDASAIDSTVLEMLITHNPALVEQLRVIETIGPSPMPPFVLGAHVPSEIRAQLQNALIRMNETEDGQNILAHARMARIARMTDADYEPIRAMLKRAREVELNASSWFHTPSIQIPKRARE